MIKKTIVALISYEYSEMNKIIKWAQNFGVNELLCAHITICTFNENVKHRD